MLTSVIIRSFLPFLTTESNVCTIMMFAQSVVTKDTKQKVYNCSVQNIVFVTNSNNFSAPKFL